MVAPSVLPGRAFQRIDRISRLLFSWRASDLSIAALTGQAPSLIRTTAGSVRDSLGIGRVPVHSQPRFQHRPNDQRARLVTEETRIQLVTDPENLGAWGISGTPVRTGGQPDPFGGTGAYLVNDDDGAVLEGMQQTVAFTGNGEKCVLLFVRQGTSNHFRFGILDTTAATVRHEVTGTWTAGVPSLVSQDGSGTIFTPVEWFDGWWLCAISAVGVVATNTNVFRIFPTSSVATDTGSTYFFGANAWNATFPATYQGPSVGTRNADNASWTIDIAPAALWIYARFVDLGTASNLSGTGIVHLGNGLSTRMLDLNATGSGVYRFTHGDSGGGFVETSLGVGPALGDLTELVGQLYDDGHVKIMQSINEGAETSATIATQKALAAAWGGAPPKLWLNSRGGAGFSCNEYEVVKVGSGEIPSVAAARAFPF